MRHLRSRTTSPITTIIAAAICVLATATPASAHHSASAYDFSKTVQYEGVLTEVKIINPHAIWKVKVAKPDGTSETYQFHGGGVTLLRNTGVKMDEFKVGTKVKIAGNAHRGNPHDVLISNLMGPSGKEWLLGVPGALPKSLWSQNASGGFTDKDLQGVKDPQAAKAGVFRTWTPRILFTDEERKGLQTGSRMTDAVSKYTPEAQAFIKKNVAARFQMEKEGKLPPCGYLGGGFSGIAVALGTTQFINKGKTIEVRGDFTNSVSTIYLETPAKKPANPRWGYSKGRWEGRTLVVTTTGVNWVGTGSGLNPLPVSDKVVYTERFTPSEDGSRLDYEMTREDPVYLNAPEVTKSHWIWRPGASIRRDGCSEDYKEPTG